MPDPQPMAAVYRAAHAAGSPLAATGPNAKPSGGAAALQHDPGFAVLLMSRLRPRAVPWALARLARGASALGAVPGMRFARVMGSGHRGGFGLRPGLDCQGVFGLFDSLEQAERFAFDSECALAYRRRSIDHFGITLQASSSRGSWAGARLQAVARHDGRGPVAVLTRGAIRPSRMLSFWRHSPPSERDLARAQGCRVAVGVGEAPLLRQATFSLWDSPQALEAYAHQGAHESAIRASWQQGFFSEWMFARFVPHRLQGRWGDRDLDLLPRAGDA